MPEGMKPEVGMGCTQHMGSDQYPYTIVRVSDSGKMFIAQEDMARRTDENGHSGPQIFEFTQTDKGKRVRVSLRKNGHWRDTEGTRYTIGERHCYIDPDF